MAKHATNIDTHGVDVAMALAKQDNHTDAAMTSKPTGRMQHSREETLGTQARILERHDNRMVLIDPKQLDPRQTGQQGLE